MRFSGHSVSSPAQVSNRDVRRRPLLRGGGAGAMTSAVMTGLTLSLSCCRPAPPAPSIGPQDPRPQPKTCAPTARGETRAPRVSKDMLTPEFWLKSPGFAKPLLSRNAISKLNAASVELEIGLRDLPAPLDEQAKVRQSVAHHIEQQEFVRAKLDNQTYVESIPGATAQADVRVTKLSPRDDYFRLTQATPLRCWPIGGSIYKIPPDPAFDRNNCSTLHPPALVHRIVSGPEEKWHYVQGSFAEGWVENPKWASVAAEAENKRNEQSHRWVLRDHEATLASEPKAQTPPPLSLRLGQVLAVDASGKIEWPALSSQAGKTTPVAPGVSPPQASLLSKQALPLQKDLLFQAAFSLLDRPYGWGGYRGERDCSRYLLDLMSIFGIRMPRFSGHQAKIGAPIDVSALNEAQKRAEIRKWNRDHVVLLFMPGHIMLYLGSAPAPHPATNSTTSPRGPGAASAGPTTAPAALHDYAISAISEYVTPCFDPGQNRIDTQVHRLDRVTVTDLELGRDTPRTSFIERITTLVVFGPQLEALGDQK